MNNQIIQHLQQKINTLLNISCTFFCFLCHTLYFPCVLCINLYHIRENPTFLNNNKKNSNHAKPRSYCLLFFCALNCQKPLSNDLAGVGDLDKRHRFILLIPAVLPGYSFSSAPALPEYASTPPPASPVFPETGL